MLSSVCFSVLHIFIIHLPYVRHCERHKNNKTQLIVKRTKKQRHHFTDRNSSSQSYDLSSSHVQMWELDHKECWALKNGCFWLVVLEKTLESPLDCKEIQPVHPKGNQSWISIGRTDVEAETPILWPPDAKNWLIGTNLDAGKDWRWEEKGTTEDEMVWWHHQLNGHELDWIPGVDDGQGNLACCRPWGCKESDMTERLNWTVTFFRGTYFLRDFVLRICLYARYVDE